MCLSHVHMEHERIDSGLFVYVVYWGGVYATSSNAQSWILRSNAACICACSLCQAICVAI